MEVGVDGKTACAAAKPGVITSFPVARGTVDRTGFVETKREKPGIWTAKSRLSSKPASDPLHVNRRVLPWPFSLS
jgi:hypothetical protein